MKKSLTVLALLFPTTLLIAMDGVYDGTGSLINSTQQCWGCDRDEAKMHPHKTMNSIVTFQVLKNTLSCDHIDIHSNIDLEQDVHINLKAWSDTSVQQSYKIHLPFGKWNQKSGVSLDMKAYSWTTLAISTTKPLNKSASIYAYCRNSTDPLNISGLEVIPTVMTKLSSDHVHLGNGSLIHTSNDNGQDGFGVKKDTAMSSTTNNAETSFQILGDKDSCSEIRLSGSTSEVEEVLVKGWSEAKWKPANCNKLPCTIKAYFNDQNKAEYTLINIKTKANHENKYLHASCRKGSVNFNLKEKLSIPKHPNDCKFTDVAKNSWGYYPYITALCSAQIVEGYGSTGYTQFGPENATLWSELTKVVNLSHNFYQTKKIRNSSSYRYGEWYDAYIDMAKKQGFSYSPGLQFNRGLGYRYIVKVFWNKDLSENEASTFLSNKGITYRSNISPTMKRGYMAEIVLKSAKISADENGIERKLPYVNHDTKDINMKDTRTIPDPTFVTPKKTDRIEKKVETIQKNIEKVTKENSTVSEKDTTNNTGSTLNLLGQKDSLKTVYKDKTTAEEIIEETKVQGVNKSINSNSKIEKDVIVELLNKDSGKIIIVPSVNKEDGEGNKKLLIETEPNKFNEITIKEAKANNLEVKSQVKIKDMLPPKE